MTNKNCVKRRNNRHPAQNQDHYTLVTAALRYLSYRCFEAGSRPLVNVDLAGGRARRHAGRPLALGFGLDWIEGPYG